MAIAYLNDKEMTAFTLASGAVAADDAANYSFRPDGTNESKGGARLCLLTNNNASGIVYYRANSNPTAGVNEASATVYDGRIGAGSTVDISLGGERAIRNVSVYIVAGATTPALRVVGLG